MDGIELRAEADYLRAACENSGVTWPLRAAELLEHAGQRIDALERRNADLDRALSAAQRTISAARFRPAPAVPVAPPGPPLVLSELDRTRLVGEFRRKAEDWGLLATTNDPGTAASTEAMYESLVDALNTGRPIVGAPLPPAPPVPERED